MAQIIKQLGSGPIAQLVEPPAHNRKVPGSNPGGPINELLTNVSNREISILLLFKSKILISEKGAPF